MTIKSFLSKLFGEPSAAHNNDVAQKESPKKEAAKKLTNITIMSPMSGTIAPLSEVPDPAFAEKLMGDGIAIIPSDNHVYAPCDGEITALFDSSKHAIGLVSKDGVEILIHIGINTVNLTNNEFNYHIKLNQKVKQGDLLLTFDMEAVKSAGYPVITPIIVLNTPSYQKIEASTQSSITPQDILLTINE